MNGMSLIKEFTEAVKANLADLEAEILDQDVLSDIETATDAVLESARADAEDTDEA